MRAGAMKLRGSDAAGGSRIAKAFHKPRIHQPRGCAAAFAKRNPHAPARSDIRHNLLQLGFKYHQMRRIIGAKIKAQFKIA